MRSVGIVSNGLVACIWPTWLHGAGVGAPNLYPGPRSGHTRYDMSGGHPTALGLIDDQCPQAPVEELAEAYPGAGTPEGADPGGEAAP
eukprot:11866035-Heterocapsa_arctica.AAC.1